MRVLRVIALGLTALSSFVLAQDAEAVPQTDAAKEKFSYQSDVARVRKIVINSLYSHREVFLRELLSNANDAVEKLRLLSLTDKDLWDGAGPLNITIKTYRDEDRKGGRIVISDTGIGMTPEELTNNLGTLAKSGTSEFLSQAEGSDSSMASNLIGSFGVGFYSSFLVADKVYVASMPPKTEKNPNPVQHVFSSTADDSSFEIYEDPRGNTLGRGTEITLVLKNDALEYLDELTLKQLINKHSSFSSTFPIYLYTQKEKEVLDEDAQEADVSTPEDAPTPDSDEEEEALVEDVKDEEEKTTPAKMKKVTVEEWEQLNIQPPLWTRDPKTVDDDEYTMFYTATFKDFSKPLAWHHFSGDSASGVPFKAIIYIPSKLDDDFWAQPTTPTSRDVRIMVKRVFITSDLGDHKLPKWASWAKVVVDAEDLELNVSRETLQNNKFLKQIKGVIQKRLLQMIGRIAEEDEEKFKKIQEVYGSVLKLGAVEDLKNREKLAALTRFNTNQREAVSLDQYLENKKEGQKQIFYLAELGKKTEDLAKSVFVEKLDARGYEVLLLNEPLDEIMTANMRQWKGFTFQDVAKAGLKFGDEELDSETDKEQQKALTEQFKPLLTWLKDQAKEVVRDVVISNRLVGSPCAIVADTYGYTANAEKLMLASNRKTDATMFEVAKKAKVLEVNPKSPLIEGLLRRVENMGENDEERDPVDEEELVEAASILIDGALIRSGFEVSDSNSFFTRVDRVLRRSLGVSEHAKTDTSGLKPAPPVDPVMPEEPPSPGQMKFDLPPEMAEMMDLTMEEIDEDGDPVHDEL